MRHDFKFELSVIMPCLNEADTLGSCLEKAFHAIHMHQISAEVIVADNGSTDGSIEIAQKAGARVVQVSEKGYGNALMGGINNSLGQFVIMGDADDSYDFLEIPVFLKKLREGYDLVQGCRFPSGGGVITPGAMPFLHRVIGNPFFTFLVQKLFRAPINDVYCGLRGFRKELYDKLEQRCVGMEFATEMIIKSSLYQETYNVRITEVPITLHKDGRKSHAPHLRTFRDGWRTLRFFMLYSPQYLYGIPSIATGLIGVALTALVYADAKIGNASFDANSLLVATLFIVFSYQLFVFGAFAKVFALGEKLIPMDIKSERLFNFFNLEKGLLAGTLGLLIGFLLICRPFSEWMQSGFGPLEYSTTMRWVIPGVTFIAIGFQTIFSSFLLSMLGLRRT